MKRRPRRRELVVVPRTLLAHVHQSGASQVREVARNRRLRPLQDLDEIADARLAALDESEEPSRIGSEKARKTGDECGSGAGPAYSRRRIRRRRGAPVNRGPARVDRRRRTRGVSLSVTTMSPTLPTARSLEPAGPRPRCRRPAAGRRGSRARLPVPRPRPDLLSRHLGDAVLRARDDGRARSDAARRAGGAAVPGQEHHQPRRRHAGQEGLRRAARGREGRPRPRPCARRARASGSARASPRSGRAAAAAAAGSRSRRSRGVVEVVRRLAHAADARFRSGVSVTPRRAARRRGTRRTVTDLFGHIVVTNNI